MASKNEFFISREFNAPRKLLFDAFTKAEHLEKWWGPKGSKIEILQLDVKAGGTFHYKLTFPDATSLCAKFVYREITRPEKIICVTSFTDEKGNSIPTPFPIKFPLEVLNTWTFAETNGKTKIMLVRLREQQKNTGDL